MAREVGGKGRVKRSYPQVRGGDQQVEKTRFSLWFKVGEKRGNFFLPLPLVNKKGDKEGHPG